MRCPHIDTARKVFAEKNGDLNCPACHESVPKDGNVRTGKKIWTGAQVDGVEGNREKVAQFGEKLQARAAKNRHRFSEPKHPALRERMGL